MAIVKFIYSELKLQRLIVPFICYSLIGSVPVVDEGKVVDEGGVVDEAGLVETEVVTSKAVEKILSLVTPEVLTKSQGKKRETRFISLDI